MPMCMELVRRIQKVTELECGDISAPHPLLSLIIQHASEGQLDCRNNRGLYVVCKTLYTISDYCISVLLARALHSVTDITGSTALLLYDREQKHGGRASV